MAGRWQPALVSVVIPTYNRSFVLARVLTALETQTLARERFEVIPVDNGSTDLTADLLATYAARCPYRLRPVQLQPNRGPAGARNAGLQEATGDIVLFIDDDCIPEPTLLAEHVASHEVENLAVIGRIVWHPELPETPFMRFLEDDLFSYDQIRLPFDAPFANYFTGNASVYRPAALAIGGLDGTFPYGGEDLDFAFRLRQYGTRIVFNSRARVLHYRDADFQATMATERGKGRQSIRLWHKHAALRDFTPFERLLDPHWARRYGRLLARYAIMLGAEAELATPTPPGPNEPLPALAEPPAELAPALAAWHDRRLVERHAAVGALGDEVARLRRLEVQLPAQQAAYARLQRRYATEARRAERLARQLAAWPAVDWLVGLTQRLSRRARRRPLPASH